MVSTGLLLTVYALAYLLRATVLHVTLTLWSINASLCSCFRIEYHLPFISFDISASLDVSEIFLLPHGRLHHVHLSAWILLLRRHHHHTLCWYTLSYCWLLDRIPIGRDHIVLGHYGRLHYKHRCCRILGLNHDRR